MRGLFIILVLLLPITGRAGMCMPGYYPKDGVCTICPQYLACPDGDINITCEPNQYTDGPGGTKCIDCPSSEKGGSIWHSREGGGREGCRENWNVSWPSGAYGYFSCSYGTDGYITGNYYAKCMITLNACAAGYAARSDSWYQFSATSRRYWVSSYDDVFMEPCVPVGIGYYSPADTTVRTVCPGGTSTHGSMAASVDECLPLCAAGATSVRIGQYRYNLWPIKSTAPALHVRFPSGICYVGLKSDNAAGGLNIKYNNVIYHAIN